MKLKDIKVGETYALGAPNATYDTFRRTQGKVVKIGVYGRVSGMWDSHESEHANYVEFEVGEDGARGSSYSMQVDKATGRKALKPFYKSEEQKKQKVELVWVHRCMASHVLMPWDEYLMRKDEHDKSERAADARRKAKHALAEQMKHRFKSRGFEPHISAYGVFSVEFNQGEAERLLDNLDTLAAYRGEI